VRKILISLVCFFFSIYQINAVAQTYAAGACTPITNSQTCIDSTPCKTDSSGKQICLAGATLPTGALAVTQTCWQYSYNYSCSSAGVDTCSTATWWNAKTCSQTSVSCSSTIPSTGACATYAYTYTCQTSPSQSSQQMVCGSNLFSSSFAAPINNNNSFATAAVAMEIARQTQVYSKCAAGSPGDCLNSLIFAGTSESCRKGDFGLKNCCKSTEGAKSNSMLMGAAFSVGSKAVVYAGQKAVDTASPYVFDAMYQGAQYAAGLAQSYESVITMASTPLANAAGATGGGTSFGSSGISAYGVTYGSSTSVVGGGLGGANVALAGGAQFASASAAFANAGSALASATQTYQAAQTAYQAGAATLEAVQAAEAIVATATEAVAVTSTALTGAASGVLMFNPYTFAIAIALQVVMQVVMEAMSCTQEEQILGMHKGASLSVFTGQTCSKKIPILGTCLEYTDSYCSFNSVLAKLVNQQGKAQLGLPFANCSGLSVAEVTSLNFSKIDLSEFTRKMVEQAQVGLPSSPAIANAYKPIASSMSNGTGQNSQSGTAYPEGYKP